MAVSRRARSCYAALSRCSQPGPRAGSRLAPQRVILRDQRERIAHWLQDDHLRLTRIHELLLRDGIAAGYPTLREFVRDEGLWKPSLSPRCGWPTGLRVR